MAHNDALEGTTYIHHGADHVTPRSKTPAQPAHDEAPRSEQSGETSKRNQELLERLEKLERDFEAFKIKTAKKLKILEKNTHTELTPEERVFMIQEDA